MSFCVNFKSSFAFNPELDDLDALRQGVLGEVNSLTLRTGIFTLNLTVSPGDAW